MQKRAAVAGREFHAFAVPGGDHFNIIAPITRMIAKKIIEDSKPQSAIVITRDEVAAAMRHGGSAAR